MKAQDILNHCEAVVKGEIPQPLPFWVTSEDSDYVFYYEKPKEDESNPILLIMWQFAPNQIPSQNLQLAARLLGLDKPEVVLHWVEEKMFTDPDLLATRYRAKYNDHLEAWIAKVEGCYLTGGIYFVFEHHKLTVLKLPQDRYTTEAAAQQWCTEKITEITTQTPKQ